MFYCQGSNIHRFYLIELDTEGIVDKHLVDYRDVLDTDIDFIKIKNFDDPV